MDEKSVVVSVVAIFAILVTFLVVRSQKQRICKALTDQGATAVNVSWDLLSSDRGVNAYEVEYTEPMVLVID